MYGHNYKLSMLVSVIFSVLSCLISSVLCVPLQKNPHLFARLVEPPPRHIYKSVNPKLQDKCSEKNWQKNQNICSACGNVPHDFHRDYKIHRKYYPGKLLPIVLSLYQVKEGYIEFSICSNGFGSTINHKCFQDNMLFVEASQSNRLYVPAMKGNISTSLIIPPEVPCDRYVLQWKYVLGDEYDVDCKHCETYIGCANIAILDPSVNEDMPKSRQKRQTDNINNGGPEEVATTFTRIPASGNKFNLSELADALSTSLGNFLFGSKSTLESYTNPDRTSQTLENSPIEKPKNTVSDFGSIKKVHSVNYLLDSKDIPVTLTNILSNAGDLGTIVDSAKSVFGDISTGIKDMDKSTMSFKMHGKPTSIKQYETEEPSISIPIDVLNSLPNALKDNSTVNTVKIRSEASKRQGNKFNTNGLANTLSTSLGRLIFGSSASKLNPMDKVPSELEIPDPTYHIKPITHSNRFDSKRIEPTDFSESSIDPVLKSVNIWNPSANVFKSGSNDDVHGLPIGFQESNKRAFVKNIDLNPPPVTVPAEGLVSGASSFQKNTKNGDTENELNKERRKVGELAGSRSTSPFRKTFGPSKLNSRPVISSTADRNYLTNQIIKNPNVDVKKSNPTNFSPRKVYQFFDLSQVDSKDISEPFITFFDGKSLDGTRKANTGKAAFGVKPRIIEENWRPKQFGNVKQNVLFDLPFGFQTKNLQTDTRPFEPTDSLAIPPEIVVARSTSTPMGSTDENTAAIATAAVVASSDGGIADTMSDAASSMKDVVSGTVDNVKDATSSVVDAMADVFSSAADAVPSIGDTSSSIGDAVSGFQDNLPEIVPKSLDSVSDVASSAVDTLSDMTSSAQDKMSDIVSSVADTASDVASSANEVIPSIGDTSVGEVMSDVASAAGEAVSELKDSLPDNLPAIIPAVGDNSVGEAVKDVASAVGDVVSSVGDSSVAEVVGEAVSGLKDALPDGLSDVVSSVGDNSVGEMVSEAASAAGEAVSGLADALPDSISDVISGGSDIPDVMPDIVPGDGVTDTAADVIENVVDGAENIADVIGDGASDIKDVVSDVVDDTKLSDISPPAVVPDASIGEIIGAVANAAAASATVEAVADAVDDSKLGVVSDIKDTISDIVDDKLKDPVSSIAGNIGDVVPDDSILSKAIDAASDMKDTIGDMVSDTKDTLSSIIGENPSNAIEKVSDGISDVVDNVKDLGSDIRDSMNVGSVSDMVDNIKDAKFDIKDSIGVSDMVDNLKDVGSNIRDTFDDSKSAAILLSGFKPVIGDVSKGKPISIRPPDSTINSNLNLFQILPSPFEQIKTTRTRNLPIFDDMPPPPPPPSIILKDASSFPDSGENIKDSKINIIPLDSRKLSPNFIPAFEKDDGKLKLKSKKVDKNLVSLSDSMLYVLAGDYGKYQLGLDKIVTSEPKNLSKNIGDKNDGRKLLLPATTQNVPSGTGLNTAATIVAVSEASAIGDSLSDVLEKVAIGGDKDKLFKLPDDIKENTLLGKMTTNDVISDVTDKISDIIDTASDVSSNIKDGISDIVDSRVDAASNVGEVVSDIASNVGDGFSDVASNAGDLVSDMKDKMSDVVDAGLDATSNVREAISDVGSNAREIVSDVIDKTSDATSNVVDTVSEIRDTVKDVGSNIADSITDNGWGKVLSNIGEGMSNVRENTKDAISNVADAQTEAFSNVRDTISNVADTGKDMMSGITDRVSDVGSGLDSDKLRNLAFINSLQNPGTNSLQQNTLPGSGTNGLAASVLNNAIGGHSGKIATTGVNLVTFFKTGASPGSSIGVSNLVESSANSNMIPGNRNSMSSSKIIVPITSTNMGSNNGQNIGLFKTAVDFNSDSSSSQNTELFRPGVRVNTDSSTSNTGRNIELFRPGVGLNVDSTSTNTVPAKGKGADSINLWTWSTKQQNNKPNVDQSNGDRMAFRRIPTSVNLQVNRQSSSALENFLLNGISKSSSFDRTRGIGVNTNLEAISGNVITRSPPPVGNLLDSTLGFQGRSFIRGTTSSLNSARGAAFRNQQRSLSVNTQTPVIGVKSRVVGDVVSPLHRPGLAEFQEIQPSTSRLGNTGSVITGSGNAGSGVIGKDNTGSVITETSDTQSDFPPTNFVSMSRINGEEYSTQTNNGPGRHSPVSMIAVCRLNEDFDCQASGSFSKVPGIDWWCVANCREGNCKQEQCKCHCISKTNQTKRVVTADEINRIIALQRETEIRLRNVQLTQRQYKLAANMNCKPTQVYRAVENIAKWCNIICAMGKCPTHVCSCPP